MNTVILKLEKNTRESKGSWRALSFSKKLEMEMPLSNEKIDLMVVIVIADKCL